LECIGLGPAVGSANAATGCWTKLVELADAAEFSAAAAGLALGVGLDRVGTAMSVFCASAAM